MTLPTPELKTAQRLKAAGFPQNTHWFYVNGLRTDDPMALWGGPNTECLAAPMLHEVLENFKDRHIRVRLTVDNALPRYGIRLVGKRRGGAGNPHIFDDNPAEAAALLWLKLNDKSDD